MQCKNGGWASFDKDNTKMIFQHIPFADHNAMLDPPTVDITGRILEMLANYGVTREDTRVRRPSSSSIASRSPTEAGSAAGASIISTAPSWCCADSRPWASGYHEPQIQQAAEWIRMVQNPDGGWGESCASYDDPTSRGTGISTASQTAWAILGLLAAGDIRSDSVAKGVRWLLQHQQADGSWTEDITRARDFRGCFTCRTTCTAIIFRFWRLTTYRRARQAEAMGTKASCSRSVDRSCPQAMRTDRAEERRRL